MVLIIHFSYFSPHRGGIAKPEQSRLTDQINNGRIKKRLKQTVGMGGMNHRCGAEALSE